MIVGGVPFLRNAPAGKSEMPAILSREVPPLSWGELCAQQVARVSEFTLWMSGLQVCAGLLAGRRSATPLVTASLMEGATCALLSPTSPEDEVVRSIESMQINCLVAEQGHEALAEKVAKERDLGLVVYHPVPRQTGRFLWDFRRTPKRTTAGFGVDLLLATSGSTGNPKIVGLDWANLSATTSAVASSLGLGKDDRCLHALPMFHIGAVVDLFLAPLSVGGAVIISPESHADAIVSAIAEFEPTWYQGVPTMLMDLLSARSKWPQKRSLRFIRSVSAKLPESTLVSLEQALGVPVIEMYGMTETAGLICSNRLLPETRKLGSVGLPLGAEVRIVGPDGLDLSPGNPGSVLVRGPGVMKGYSGDDSRSTFEGSWFITGDEGKLDEEGFLFLVGRTKEIINRGGEKISPLEVDQVAISAPWVKDAAAFSIEHPTLGEDVALAVIPSEEWNNSEEELLRFMRQRLSAHKVPRRIIVVDSFPRTKSGKLRRGALSVSIGSTDFDKPGHERADCEGPHDALAGHLADLFRKVLAVDDFLVTDNLFERGGDSLKVATLTSELLQVLGVRVTGGDIFDYPVPVELAKHLYAQGFVGLLTNPLGSGLSDDNYRTVSAALAVWPGEAPLEGALLRQLNQEAEGAPLFWCCPDANQFRNLAANFTRKRRLFGLRMMGPKTNKRAALPSFAAHYSMEIQRVYPTGPVHLGGSCLHGELAFFIAQRLASEGRVVERLILHDAFVPEHYAGRVCLSVGRPGWFSAAHRFVHPEKGWRRYYTGPLFRRDVTGPHGKHLSQSHAANFAQMLEAELSSSLDSEHAVPETAYQGPPLSASVCAADLKISSPAHAREGSVVRVLVSVTNRSEQAWEPSVTSGLLLGCLRHKSALLAHAQLERTVAPGETIELEMRFRLEGPTGPRRFRVDMFDDGIDWFHHRLGKRPPGFDINVRPGPATAFRGAKTLARWFMRWLIRRASR